MPTAFVREVLLPRDPQQQPALAPDACRYVLQVRRSPVHGWGLFTTERIPARRRVIEYGGQRISASEVLRRRLRPQLFIVRLDPNTFIDGAIDGTGAECANQGCAPNLLARRRGARLYLVSTRPIDAGEELLWNYNLAGPAPWRCGCGAAGCRG